MPTLPLIAVGRFLIVADPLSPADAILPLAGGLERVRYAAMLYDSYASQFLVTNMGLRSGHITNYAKQARDVALDLGVPGEAIALVPGIAVTTAEEALNTRALAEEKGLQSLIVLTSPSHTRRAHLIFRQAFRGTSIRVSIQPLPNQDYRADSWWQSEEGRRETGLEYLKLAAYFIGIR